MAEEAKEQEAPAGGQQQETKPKSTAYIILILINMCFMGAIGAMLYLDRQNEAAQPTIEDVVRGESQAQAEEEAADTAFIGDVIPLETFIVNLAGSRGRSITKINMNLEVEGDKVQGEIDKRKPQIRDIIIILLSSKTFDEVSTAEGKDFLREEIRNTLNAFLTTGKVKRVYFTEFVYN